METLVIEVRDQKGIDLLRNLEALQIIRVIDQSSSVGLAESAVHSDTQHSEKRKAADRFAGKLSAQTAEKLGKHIQQSRDEWDRI